MSLLDESVNFKKHDVRMVERNVARGVISRAEMDTTIEKLEDDAENAEWVSIDSLSLEADESDLGDKTSQSI